MRNVLVVLVLLIAGCAYRLDVLPRDGSAAGHGEARPQDNSVLLSLNGKTYTGTYVHDVGLGFGGFTSGLKTGSGYSTGTGGNGRLLATSGDDTIRCEFQLEFKTGIGACSDNAGKQYDLRISH